jgi:hypothetical protein
MKTIFEISFKVEKQANDSFTLYVPGRYEMLESDLTYAFTTIDDLYAFLSAEKINFKAGRT